MAERVAQGLPNVIPMALKIGEGGGKGFLQILACKSEKIGVSTV
jgi:hypothetical protein